MVEFIYISLLLIVLICGEAVYEAAYDEGYKLYSGFIEFIVKGFFIIIFVYFLCPEQNQMPESFYANDPLRLFIAYISFRYALFDLTYNGFRGIRPLWFIGSTKMFDRFFRWFFEKTKFPQRHFLIWSRVLFFILGTGMIYQIYL